MEKVDRTLELVIAVFLGIALGATLVATHTGKYCTGKVSEKVPPLETNLDTLDSWQVLQMALAMTESQFNSQAIGKNEDWGILQQTPIYVQECNRILDLRKDSRPRYTHEDSFSMVKSLEMFNLLQGYHNPGKDLNKALTYQNKADWYARRVKENTELIQNMEKVRRCIKIYPGNDNSK